MRELDRSAVVTANDAWVLNPPGAEVVETGEYRLARFPDGFPDPLQLSWLRTDRPAEDVLAEVVARAAEFGLPELFVYVKLSAPAGLDEALLARGARLAVTCDVLARPLPATMAATEPAGLELRWRTESRVARDANLVGIAAFGGSPAPEEALAERAASDRESFAAGGGGGIVAYLDGEPVGTAGLELVDGVARLAGGTVLEKYRGRGVYRALLAARLSYAAEHGGVLAFTHGVVTTSSPILRRLGFTAYGQERMYRLPLA